MRFSSPLSLALRSRRTFTRAGRHARAFTLLEILVVLAIIGLLVGLAVTRTGNIFGGAQVSTAQLTVQAQLKTPIETYRLAVGVYPSTAEGLQALLVAPSGKADRWTGPYIESPKNLIDPWGNPYQYAFPGSHNKDRYDLWSRGIDGQDGTADDIGNWDKPTIETK